MNQAYGISYKERLPMIYDTTPTDGLYTVFTKDGYDTLAISDFKNLRSKPISANYVPIPKDKRSKNSLEDEYKEFVKDADLMKTLTVGVINMYKTGRNATTALKLFYDFCNELRTMS